MAQGLTQTEFARLSGCVQSTVGSAVRAGRLALLPDGGIDPAQVGTQWRANPNRSKPATPGTKVGRPKAKANAAYAAYAAQFAAVRAQKERALAGLRRLAYEQRANSLISLATAQRVFAELWQQTCDSWLAWPSTAGPAIALELGLDPDRVTRALDRLVREHVASMGQPQPDFTQRMP
jgi:hypothetical protein